MDRNLLSAVQGVRRRPPKNESVGQRPSMNGLGQGPGSLRLPTSHLLRCNNDSPAADSLTDSTHTSYLTDSVSKRLSLPADLKLPANMRRQFGVPGGDLMSSSCQASPMHQQPVFMTRRERRCSLVGAMAEFKLYQRLLK